MFLTPPADHGFLSIGTQQRDPGRRGVAHLQKLLTAAGTADDGAILEQADDLHGYDRVSGNGSGQRRQNHQFFQHDE